jgi:hypothetical protein
MLLNPSTMEKKFMLNSMWNSSHLALSWHAKPSSKCKETKDPYINPKNAKFSSPLRYGEIASDGDG